VLGLGASHRRDRQRTEKKREGGSKRSFLEQRFSLGVVADHILALRQPPKQHEKKAAESGSEAIRRSIEHSRLEFDDAISW
jgi:hypothetical protein